MSEHYTPTQYNIPADLMEPQPPITPVDRAGNQYHVVNREDVESEQLRSIPDAAKPVFLQSPTGEKAFRSADFKADQDNAYAEREARRNVIYEQMAKRVVAETVIVSHDDVYSRMLSGEDDYEGSVEDAAVHAEETPEERLTRERQNEDSKVWNANIQNYENGKQ